MSSIVEVCNMALTAIGEDSITSLNDGNKVANLCNALWVPTRDYIQALHEWPECRKRATLVASATSPNHEWAYAYTVPSDALAIMALYEHDRLVADYVIEAGFLLTNSGSANVVYIAKISDTTKWSTALVDVMRLKLALELVMGTSARTDIYDRMAAQYATALRISRGLASKNVGPRPIFISSWITARGSTRFIGQSTP